MEGKRTLQTIDFWQTAYIDYEDTHYLHKINSFETWLEQTYRCTVSFAEYELSAAFVFEREVDFTAFVLKYSH